MMKTIGKRVYAALLAAVLLLTAMPIVGVRAEKASGDVNFDGIVDIQDAMAAYTHAAGMAELNEAQQAAADLNGDRSVDIDDAKRLYDVASGTARLEDVAEDPKPAVLSVEISELSPQGYRVTATFANMDNIGYADFPSWTAANGQDDIQWKRGQINGNTATCYIKTADHNNESGVYYTHIYFFDSNGRRLLAHSALVGSIDVPRVLKGIDVSYAQGTVNWEKVKAAGIDFAVIRCGYGQDQLDQDDDEWERNTAECERVGLPYGAYFFCYARNETEARGEAKHALRLLKGKKLTYPVYYDLEDSSWQGTLSNSTYAKMAKIWCDTLSAAGYQVGVYSNLYWWENKLTDPCFDHWSRWVAQYNNVCEYEGVYQMWQYSDTGTVNGISSMVDMNECYVDFAVCQTALTALDGSYRALPEETDEGN